MHFSRARMPRSAIHRAIIRRDKVSVIEHPSITAHRAPASRTPRVTVAQLALRAVRSWQRNRAINEFSRLDDRQLTDIGISRIDIPRVVAGLLPSGGGCVQRSCVDTGRPHAAVDLKPCQATE